MVTSTPQPSKSSSHITRKGVVFDESRNTTREVPKTDKDDKSLLWMSKLQIRENRIQVQAENLLEKTRELVKEQLIQQAIDEEKKNSTSIETDPKILIEQAQALQTRLDEIMNSSKEEIVAFLESSSKYNWITDSQKLWKELPLHIQKAARTLGYTSELWDNPANSSPLSFDLTWDELNSNEQSAARTLGYTDVTWNAAFDTGEYMDIGTTGGTVQTSPHATATAEQIVEPEYNWDDPQDESSSSASPDMNEQTPIISDSDSDEAEPNSMLLEYNWNDAGAHGSSSTDSEDQEKETNPDVDEEEFISNFLTDATMNSQQATSRLSGNLQSRYVPSDDELDLEEDQPTMNETGFEDVEDFHQESSPLLGGTHRSTDGLTTSTEPQTVVTGGLFRRGIHSSSSATNETEAQSRTILQGDEDDIEITKTPALGWRGGAWNSSVLGGLLLLGLALGWTLVHAFK